MLGGTFSCILYEYNSRRDSLELREVWDVSSKNKEDVKLELGEHQIAEELSELKIGKLLGYRYCPHAQGILTPPFESFAG